MAVKAADVQTKRYYLEEGGVASLSVVRGVITCDHCGYNLGQVGDDTLLVRSVATVYDMKTGELAIRCGQCKKFSKMKAKMPELAALPDKI